MRTIKELLILLREGAVIRIQVCQYGLCGTIDWMCRCMESINNDESKVLENYIESHKPDKVCSAFWWPRGELAPRLEFLDKLIAELE